MNNPKESHFNFSPQFPQSKDQVLKNLWQPYTNEINNFVDIWKLADIDGLFKEVKQTYWDREDVGIHLPFLEVITYNLNPSIGFYHLPDGLISHTRYRKPDVIDTYDPISDQMSVTMPHEAYPDLLSGLASDYGAPPDLFRLPPSKISNAIFIMKFANQITDKRIVFPKKQIVKIQPLFKIEMSGFKLKCSIMNNINNFIWDDTLRSQFRLIDFGEYKLDRSKLEQIHVNILEHFKACGKSSFVLNQNP